MDKRLKEIKREYVSYSDIATNKNSKVLADIHYLIGKAEQTECLKMNEQEKKLLQGIKEELENRNFSSEEDTSCYGLTKAEITFMLHLIERK